MNTSTSFSLGRLSLGVSRLGIRHGHTQTQFRTAKPDLAGFEPGHGEQIWIFHNFMTKQVVYSHKPVMKSNRALAQLPFNGKNRRPAKLRRDYWRPFAMIQFAEGAGQIGQSVFQKLREFRTLHEISWGYQAEDLLKKSRQWDRGFALNDQQANTVADVSAALAGAGRGNKMWLGNGAAASSVEAGGEAGAKQTKQLAEVTVHWANPEDLEYAKEWTPNVKHALGLPKTSRKPFPEDGVTDEALSQDRPETTATAL